MPTVKEAVANTRKNRAAGGPGPNTTFVSGDTAGGTIREQAPPAPLPVEDTDVDKPKS